TLPRSARCDSGAPARLGTFDERMKPGPRGELPWRQAAELLELRDHVRLIGIAETLRDIGPINRGSTPRVRQPGVKSHESAIQLRRQPDDFAKHARKMLSRHASFFAQTLYAHLSTPFADTRGDPVDAHARIESVRQTTQQFTLQASNPFGFGPVCEFGGQRGTRSPEMIERHHGVRELCGRHTEAC